MGCHRVHECCANVKLKSITSVPQRIYVLTKHYYRKRFGGLNLDGRGSVPFALHLN